MLYATGLKEEDMSKAQVGVCKFHCTRSHTLHAYHVAVCGPVHPAYHKMAAHAVFLWLLASVAVSAYGLVQVGIGSVWYDGNPCNMHLNSLAATVRSGVQDAGLVGYQFNTVGVSDAMSMGTDGMSYSLPSRDLIADSMETVMGAQAWPLYIACLHTCYVAPLVVSHTYRCVVRCAWHQRVTRCMLCCMHPRHAEGAFMCASACAVV
jgi:hypothetical protein